MGGTISFLKRPRLRATGGRMAGCWSGAEFAGNLYGTPRQPVGDAPGPAAAGAAGQSSWRGAVRLRRFPPGISAADAKPRLLPDWSGASARAAAQGRPPPRRRAIERRPPAGPPWSFSAKRKFDAVLVKRRFWPGPGRTSKPARPGPRPELEPFATKKRPQRAADRKGKGWGRSCRNAGPDKNRNPDH